MDNADRNQFQIVRKDARNCFVESKSDSFSIGKAHLEFATYNASKPSGQRQISHVHIYLGMPEFYGLAHIILHGHIHATMAQYKKAMREIETYKNGHGGQLSEELQKKQAQITKPLFQSLGGTSAERLRQSGRERKDGMSESRSVALFVGTKADYLLCAESGQGQTDAKGLIVPKYGSKPEQRVAVSISYQNLNELMLMTRAHYEAWLTAQYLNKPERMP